MIQCRRATIKDLRYLIQGNRSIANETEGIELSEAKLGPGITAILEDGNKESTGSQPLKIRSLGRFWLLTSGLIGETAKFGGYRAYTCGQMPADKACSKRSWIRSPPRQETTQW